MRVKEDDKWGPEVTAEDNSTQITCLLHIRIYRCEHGEIEPHKEVVVDANNKKDEQSPSQSQLWLYTRSKPQPRGQAT